MTTTNERRLCLKLKQHCNNQQSTTRALEHIGHRRSVTLCLASIPPSPQHAAQRHRPSGLPTPSRYFIFTLLLSFSLLHLWVNEFETLYLCLSLSEIVKWELRLSLSLSLYLIQWFSLFLFEVWSLGWLA